SLSRKPTASDSLIPAPAEGARVLIVEDTEAVAALEAELVGLCHHHVVGRATHGAEGVDFCRRLKPDVVLMDVEMPELDGIEATREIMGCCPTPVVILSAHESEDVVTRAADAGASAYLVKPPTAGDLGRAIEFARARFFDLMEVRRVNAELVSRSRDLEAANADLKQALAQVDQLSGLLPICASCKKVRDDAGYWHQVESYVSAHSGVRFSHGLCPSCFSTLYPELVDELDEEPGPY
ncbi:MAG: response regulator, partial [Deltaproteobacteria bacterium]|nr:response regulator [Deltaproteobacteria bacterium]